MDEGMSQTAQVFLTCALFFIGVVLLCVITAIVTFVARWVWSFFE